MIRPSGPWRPAGAPSGAHREQQRSDERQVRAPQRTAKRLRTLWKTEPGWKGWFGTVDHKKIGKRYLVTAFAFLLVGGGYVFVTRRGERPIRSLDAPALRTLRIGVPLVGDGGANPRCASSALSKRRRDVQRLLARFHFPQL